MVFQQLQNVLILLGFHWSEIIILFVRDSDNQFLQQEIKMKNNLNNKNATFSDTLFWL